MRDMIRDAALGQVIRFVTRNRVLRYADEMPDFQLPEAYNTAMNTSSTDVGGVREKSVSAESSEGSGSGPEEKDGELPELAKKVTTKSVRGGDLEGAPVAMRRTKTRESTKGYTNERLEVEQELALERTKTTPIAPTKTSDGNILVDWVSPKSRPNALVSEMVHWRSADNIGYSGQLMMPRIRTTGQTPSATSSP